MKIAIVGAGAIGSLLGGFIKKAGYDVTLIDNYPERVNIINAGGLHIDGVSGSHHIVIPSVIDSCKIGVQDLVFMCVKAYDTLEAIKQHSCAVGPNTTVVTMQNGLGNIKAIADTIGPEKVVGGVTTLGAFQTEPGYIHHAGLGESHIGEISGATTPRLEKIARILADAGFPIMISQSIEELIWSKLVINVGINALTALLRVRNGVLLQIPESKQIMRGAVAEALAVAKAKGIELDETYLQERVEIVASKTAQNRSSMLTDVLNNKRTEIDFINGAIVSEAEKLNINVPINSTLHKLVRAIETTHDRREN